MIKLVVDCTCEIDQDKANELQIISIPMTVSFSSMEYLAGVELSNTKFYELLKQSKELPHTSQINESTYIDIIKPLLDNGDEVFVMCLSSELSGTFNSLMLAQEALNSKNLEILDTETTTFAYKALVYEAIKEIKKGTTLHQLKEKLEFLKSKLRLYAIIDNVKYLIKGGRLSLAKGFVVGALNIKPIVTIKDKVVKVVGNGIGYNIAKKNMCKFIKNIDYSMPAYFAHSNDVKKAEDIKSTMEQKFGFSFNEMCEIGPIIGTHTGPGCVGIAYFEK